MPFLKFLSRLFVLTETRFETLQQQYFVTQVAIPSSLYYQAIESSRRRGGESWCCYFCSYDYYLPLIFLDQAVRGATLTVFVQGFSIKVKSLAGSVLVFSHGSSSSASTSSLLFRTHRFFSELTVTT